MNFAIELKIFQKPVVVNHPYALYIVWYYNYVVFIKFPKKMSKVCKSTSSLDAQVQDLKIRSSKITWRGQGTITGLSLNHKIDFHTSKILHLCSTILHQVNVEKYRSVMGMLWITHVNCIKLIYIRDRVKTSNHLLMPLKSCTRH